jgi:hypothetical protein
MQFIFKQADFMAARKGNWECGKLKIRNQRNFGRDG